MNVIPTRCSIGVLRSIARERRVETGACFVDVVLKDRGVDHGGGGDEEADRDACDWAELDASFEHGRVHDAVEDGHDDDDGYGVEVLHQIVRDAVSVHLAGLRHKVGRELAVDDPEDREKYKYAHGDEGALELIDEVIVPRKTAPAADLRLVRGFGSIHVASLYHDPDGLEGVGNDTALRGADNVELATEDQDGNADGEHAKRE